MKKAEVDHSKAITYQKNSVIDDFKRLTDKDNSYLLLIVYPLFEDSYKYWNEHIQEIKKKGVKKELNSEEISLKNGKMKILLYEVE